MTRRESSLDLCKVRQHGMNFVAEKCYCATCTCLYLNVTRIIHTRARRVRTHFVDVYPCLSVYMHCLCTANAGFASSVSLIFR